MQLDVLDVNKSYGKESILHHIEFSVGSGEIVGLVGESGCGKSTLARLLCCYEKPDSGKILFCGEDTAGFGKKERQQFRRSVQMILQDSLSSLDPKMSVGQTLHETLKYNGVSDVTRREEKIRKTLEIVLLPADLLAKRPSQLSGGERQRINICRALLVEPQLLICDEITSSLDVLTRYHLLGELKRLNKEKDLPMVFISHDLKSVKSISDRILVMYRGRIVEELKKEDGFHYEHLYTARLLESLPIDHPSKRESLVHNFEDDVLTAV